MTVRDLAAAAGISPSYVSLIENGHKVPDASTIERLGRVLELDPVLLRAWTTVRGRSADATESIQAAHELMARLEVLDQSQSDARSACVEEPTVVYRLAPPMAMRVGARAASGPAPERRREAPRVRMLPEGAEPGGPGDGEENIEPLVIDRRAVSNRDELRDAFAWQLTPAGLARIPDVFGPGDMVVIAPGAWEARPESFPPLAVFAVRMGGRAVLSRVAWTGSQLVLHGSARAPVEILEAATEEQLRSLIAGRVIAAVRRVP